MMTVILSALMSIVTRLVTAEFIQFAVIKGLEAISRKTDNTYDDEFVAEIKKLLNKSDK